jgi:predicted dehydrogenase
LRFTNGALGTIAATTGAYPGVTTRIEIFGDKGSAVIENDSLSYLHLARDEKESVGAYGADPKERTKGKEGSSTSQNPDAYQELRPWLRYIHVKDALANGTVVAAGEGVARWPEILQQLHTDGYEGFFSLEPHLALSGQYQGFSGPDLFRHASQALQNLLQSMDLKYE